MNDPLDAVFVHGDEAAELKRIDIARKLATYLERMPAELHGLFTEQFQHISTSELSQLRAALQAAQERIAQLESIIALNRYVTPPFDLIDDATAKLALECAEKDRRIAEQARQLEAGRTISDVELSAYRYYLGESDDRLRELFDDMPADERERYCKAHAVTEPQP